MNSIVVSNAFESPHWDEPFTMTATNHCFFLEMIFICVSMINGTFIIMHVALQTLEVLCNKLIAAHYLT